MLSRIIFNLFVLTFLLCKGKKPLQVCPEVISKNEWGARGAKLLSYAVFPTEFVIIHHSLTPNCNDKQQCSQLLCSIQNFHMDVLRFEDIAYNFMIGDNGRIYEGRGWHKIGAHTKGYNSKSIGIAFLGTFTNKLPSLQQLEAAQNFLKCGVAIGELDPNYKLLGARQLSQTKSPGLKLYNEIKKWEQFTNI